ncbi:ACP S-malonyltransferase [Candidatus Amarolinea aalborgensis]|uniref:ACP S-malonyltransferase n=1 Tax=Candidatus Amarolinea aalborgensis TaxID=2249329 RepID=UPI003BFA2521
MPHIAYIFPGQGSQVVGMGQALAGSLAAAAAVFAEADQLLGFSLSDLCFNGPAEALNQTINTQPALFVTSIAAWRAIEAALGQAPPAQFVAGHSLGEYSALVAAGVLSFADGLRLVRLRGQLMGEADETAPGGMAAILALDAAAVDAVCAEARTLTGGVVQVANYNSPGQVVISGDDASLAQALEIAKARGARKSIRLPISIAAHSPLMAPAAVEMSRAITATDLWPPRTPVVSNITALPLTTVEEIRRELVGQLTAGVRWEDSVRMMAAEGADLFIEIGAGNVLTGLVKRIVKDVGALNVGDAAGIEQMRALL